MARKIRRGQTGADSELTARLRKLQEASQVPPEPEVVEKTGRSYIDNIVQRRANAGINPKQRDLEIEDYTYIQPGRILRQQVPPSRMITNPEEMEERLQAIARNYFPADKQRKSKDERIKSEPYSRGRNDFRPREEVSRGEEQDFMGARQQDVRRFKGDIDPYISKDDQRSLAEDLISMRFKDRAIRLMGAVGSDKEQRVKVLGGEDLIVEPNTINVYKKDYGATPSTMAHEYRHFTGSDDGTQNDELFNRIMDTYTAQTPTELKDSIEMVIFRETALLKHNTEAIEERKPGFNVDEKISELQKIRDSLNDSDVNLSQKFTEILENSYYSDGVNDFAQKQIKGKYEPSPFLTELLGAQEDRRLADTKK